VALWNNSNCEFLFVLPCVFVFFYAENVLCRIIKITITGFIILLLQFMKVMFIAQWCLYPIACLNIFSEKCTFYPLRTIVLLSVINKFFFFPIRRLEYILCTYRISLYMIYLNYVYFIKKHWIFLGVHLRCKHENKKIL
jgi:hypothetical protein